MARYRKAEFVPTFVEVKEVIIVTDYDEEGNVIGEHEEEVVTQKPSGGEVRYRDYTDEEMADAHKDELEQLITFRPTTIEEKLQMLADQITEEYPEGTIMGRSMDSPITLPFKVGYKWEKKLVGNTIVYDSVPDPNATGTIENPIYYNENSPLIDNAFYMKDGVIQVYMSGEFEVL